MDKQLQQFAFLNVGLSANVFKSNCTIFKKRKHQRRILMPGVKCDLFQLDLDQNWECYFNTIF